MFISPDSVIPNFSDPEFGHVYDPQMFNRYSYCRNNPLRFTDPTGQELQVIGTEKEVEKVIEATEYISGTKLNSDVKITKNNSEITKTIIGFESVDDKFKPEQEFLKELIDSEEITTIKFDGEAGLYGGGCYDPDTNTVKLLPSLLTDEKKCWYWNISKQDSFMGKYLGRHDTNFVYFNAWDVLAHELLGHGIDKIRGQGRNETTAVERANQVRLKRNKPVRNAGGPLNW